ncbi:nucleobase transporter [Leishmania mexicana MHOM/GT/2001/U1103]|uniref:Nucleobase transporter n=1 Tax=Leishmania mexicana (strain MHOM/GT/2001/U1103) TaxID=929439 RepID=E9ANK1_LEIMU|nr:nucleobase transporter [Leishmania mexicana MHOM/GT/2001/U1103]CBZ24511.1 nucleobase transporter [Leishmania mexicana MHOM/GT/2001/U1103]
MSKLPQAAMVVTSLVVGVTMVMGPNAINSAPSFMLEYYKYLVGNEAAEALSPVFWRNILSFYTVVTMVAQAIHEPTNLTSFMCRFSLLFRLQVSCVMMMIELLVILIMPHTHTPEYGAIAAMMIVAYLGGAARAYFENTGYALFGPCPPVMMTGMLVGSAVSGALVSVLQIILKVSMSDTYSTVLTQSLIYFCLAIGIIFLSGVFLMILPYNPYARRYVAEFRSRRGPWANIYCPRKVVKETSDDGACGKSGAAGLEDSPACRYLANSGSEKKPEVLLETERGDVAASGNRAHHHPNVLYDDHFTTEEFEGEPMQEFTPEPGSHDGAAVNATQRGARDCAHPQTTSGEVSNEVVGQTEANSEGENNDFPGAADRMLTTAELLQEVKLWPVTKKIYPMMITCFLTFCITYLVYPGIIVAVDSADGWFTTLIIAAYNFADLIGRLLTLWKRLWPSRKVILIASITRIIFIPLLVLCAVHKIPSKAVAYVLTITMGLSNGFVGALSMIYSPETPSLSTDGERAMAGQLTGACLLIGCAVGSLIQLGEVVPFT